MHFSVHLPCSGGRDGPELALALSRAVGRVQVRCCGAKITTMALLSLHLLWLHASGV